MNQQEVETLLETREQQKKISERRLDEPTGRLGIVTADPVGCRLLEGLSIQLGLQPEILESSCLDGKALLRFETVVADEGDGVRFRDTLRALGDGETGNPSALVTAHPRRFGAS